MENKIGRNGAIEFWRFIFALLVVHSHAGYIPSYFSGEYSWIKGQYICVEFFFILSGFLMAKSALKYQESTGTATAKFVFGKWLSILPIFICSYLISLITKILTEPNEWLNAFTGSFFEIFMLQITDLARLNGYPMHFVAATWYISTMLLSMLILFPLLHAKRDLFLNVICPLLAIFIMQDKCGKLGTVVDFTSTFGQLTRGIAAICIGCMAYNICSTITEKANGNKPTTLLKTLLTILEFAGYISVIVVSLLIEKTKWDFVAIIILATAVVISFSGLSYSGSIFASPLFSFLGKLSLSIYLNHFLWFLVLRTSNMNLTLTEELLISIPPILTSSLFCVFLVDTLSILWKKHKHKIKSLFIKEENPV